MSSSQSFLLITPADSQKEVAEINDRLQDLYSGGVADGFQSIEHGAGGPKVFGVQVYALATNYVPENAVVSIVMETKLRWAELHVVLDDGGTYQLFRRQPLRSRP